MIDFDEIGDGVGGRRAEFAKTHGGGKVQGLSGGVVDDYQMLLLDQLEEGEFRFGVLGAKHLQQGGNGIGADGADGVVAFIPAGV